jgi:tetratricopeptide (TPR) repeat protein
LLRRLAVFAGGSTLEAIEAICAGDGLEAEQILDLLSGLVNKSMVSAERKQQEETRYRLLETVRQYAREKLYETKESQVFYDRHLNYYLEMAEAIEPQLRTSVALERLHTLEREADNLRTALSWALDEIGSHRIEAGLRLASALLNLWHTQNFHSEGYAWLKKGLSAEAGLPADAGERSAPSRAASVRAKACFAAGHLILPLGRIAEARGWLQESLAIYREIEDTRGVVMAQSLLGEIYAWGGSSDEAKELGAESLALCRTLNDAWLLAWVLCRFGTSLFYLGEYSLARPLLEESLPIFEQQGDPLQVGDHLIMLGYIAFNRGDLNEAQAYFTKTLASAQAMHSQWTEANARLNLGRLAYMQGEYQQMQIDILESVALTRETGSPTFRISLLTLGVAEINLGHPRQAALHFKECLRISTDHYDVAACFIGMARVALQMDQAGIAARLLGAAQRFVDVEDYQYGLVERKEYERGWAGAKAQLGETAFEQALAEGGAKTLEQAVAYALEDHE